MDSGAGDSWPISFGKALDQALSDGIQKDRQDVNAYRLARMNAGRCSRLPSPDWGVIVE